MIDIHLYHPRPDSGCRSIETSESADFPIPLPLSDNLRQNFRVLEFSRKAEVRLLPEMTDDAICLVRRGRVRLLARFPTAHEGCRNMLTDILPPGGVFGQPRHWRLQAIRETAIAAEGTEIWAIAASRLEQLLARLPGAAAFFCRMLDRQIFRQKQRRVHVTALDVPARLAATLLEMAEQFGVQNPSGQGIRLSGISQQDMADLIGASRSFVSTLINMMKLEGFLIGIGRSIVISRSDKLEQLAEGRTRLLALSSLRAKPQQEPPPPRPLRVRLGFEPRR